MPRRTARQDNGSARILKTTGVRVLGYNATGFRSLVVRSKSVNNLADFKGLKVRVPESPLMVSLFRNLGANPTPIPWGELYTALQTGVIDAAESPPSALDSIKIFEVAKNLTLTNHVYTNGFIVINDKAWQGLSPKSQSALAKAVLAGQRAQREVLLAEQGKIIAELKKRGVNVIEIDTAPLRAAVAPMYAEFTKKVGDQTLLDALAKSK